MLQAKNNGKETVDMGNDVLCTAKCIHMPDCVHMLSKLVCMIFICL